MVDLKAVSFSIMPKEIPQIGRVFKSDQGDRWLTSANVTGTDSGEMSASAIITTPAFDRENDSLNPMGATTKNYSMNPVVLWNHGFNHDLPIGISEDRNGDLTLRATKSGITATCFFSKSLKLANQVFNLVEEKIVRATSVRFTPNEPPVRKAKGLFYPSWDMEEWSWTTIGVNPEAVREVFSKGRLAGSPICTSLMKSFSPMLPSKRDGVVQRGPKQVFTGGWLDLTKGRDMKQTPFGAQVLMATHCSLKSLESNLKSAMNTLEHPRVSQRLAAILKSVEEMEEEVEGTYDEEYPDEEMKIHDPDMKSECDCEDDEKCDCKKEAPADEIDSSEYKSFLAQNELKRYEVSKVNRMLSVVAGDSNLTPIQKSTLNKVSKKLSKVIREAREWRPEKENTEDPKLKSAIADAAKYLSDLEEKLSGTVPADKQ